MNDLIIFAKYPEPGKVKTRLGKTIGFELACEFYKVFLKLTFDMAKNSSINSVKIYFAPEDKKDEFGKMIPDEFSLFPQSGGSLGTKLHNAFRDSFNSGANKTVIIGSDSPTLPSTVIRDAINHLNDNDLVLGPADDGGYYLIGTSVPYEFLFEDIDWSTTSVLAQTLSKAKQNKLKHCLLQEWYDVDDLPSLKKAKSDDTSGVIAELMNKHSAMFPHTL